MNAFTKLTVPLLLFLISLPVVSMATEISGDIWGVWDSSGNPYNVVGEVRVPPDSTLMIQAGCRIIFQGHYKFIIDSLAVLQSIGVEGDSISFTAADTLEGWLGFRFYYASVQSQLSYCIIENGNADGYGFDEFGGGVFLDHSPILIANCTIKNNKAYSGGGIYCYYSGAVISENEILLNQADRFGGGIKIRNSDVAILNNRLFGNNSSYGGGLEISFSEPLIRGNIIRDNRASRGGGLQIRNCGFTLLSNNISSNSSVLGGGCYIYQSVVSLGEINDRCNIYDNCAGEGNDLYAEDCQTVDVFADTLTLAVPDEYCIYPLNSFNIDAINGYYELMNNDVYVSPDGDNNNDGLTPQTPLKNIRNALIRLSPTPNNRLTVNLLPGLYSKTTNDENFPLNAKSYTNIVGEDSSSTHLSAENRSNLIYCINDTGCAFTGLTLTEGLADSGGCIYSEWSEAEFNNNIISNNHSRYGGAVFSRWSNLSFSNNEFSSNNGGAVFSRWSSLSLSNNEFSSNNADSVGGAVFCGNNIITAFSNNYFHDNHAVYAGGAIYQDSGFCGYDGNNISENMSSSDGGGIYINSGSVFITDNSVSGNHAEGNGGGIYINLCNLSTISGNTITGNSAGLSYGGVFFKGEDIIFNSNSIDSNTALNNGGGMGFQSSNFTMLDNHISYNRAITGDGGGMALLPQFVCQIGRNVVVYNKAGSSGGGIYTNYPDIEYHGITIAFNSARSGGGIYRKTGCPYSIGTPDSPCNIYCNNAGFANDIYAGSNQTLSVYADTFTMAMADGHLIADPAELEFSANFGYYDPIYGDIYISPDGDNFDNGITPATPLKNIYIALIRAVPDQANRINVYLAPGNYSSLSNQELFPINAKSYVNIQGTNAEDCILQSDSLNSVMAAIKDTGMAFTNLTITGGRHGFDLDHSRGIEISYSIIKNNNSDPEYGGGILAEYSSLDLHRNIITNNSANWVGGGAYFLYSVCRLENNTFYGNYVDDHGGAIAFQQSNIYSVNNIFWHDHSDNGENEIATIGTGGIFEFNYNDIEGGFAGEGNINEWPIFIGAPSGNFHIRPRSPCIDTGDPRSPLDPDGTRADMGVFYYDQNVGIESNELIPLTYELKQNFPNPFNANTIIKFSVPESQHVSVNIYNVLGQKVVDLLDRVVSPGCYQIKWDGKDENGNSVSSGAYIYKLQTQQRTMQKKMILLK